MIKTTKHHKIITIIIILILCWGAMLLTDYSLYQKAKPPIFSLFIPVTDQSMYKGLGYTIVLRFNGPVGMSEEQLQGYFYWGWR